MSLLLQFLNRKQYKAQQQGIAARTLSLHTTTNLNLQCL